MVTQVVKSRLQEKENSQLLNRKRERLQNPSDYCLERKASSRPAVGELSPQRLGTNEMLCGWYTFSSSTDQEDADEKRRDQSRDVFSKHPIWCQIRSVSGSLEINSLCEV